MDDEVSAQVGDISSRLDMIRRIRRQGTQPHVEEGLLTMPQMNVLRTLTREDGLALDELSKRMFLAHSTVSGIVDRLAKKGLVERRADEVDRRRTRIYTAAVVKQYVQEQESPWTSLLARALSSATSSERTAILDAFRLLTDLLEAEAGTAGD